MFSHMTEVSLDLPFFSSVAAHSLVFAPLLQKYGSHEQKEELLIKVSRGEVIGAIANSEEGSGTDLRRTKSVTKKIENEWNVKGQKNCVTNGSIADIVFATTWLISDDHSTLNLEMMLLKDTMFNKRSLNSSLSVFRTGETGSIYFDCKFSSLDDVILGKKGEGRKILRECFNVERYFMGWLVYGILKGIEREAKSLYEQMIVDQPQLKEAQFLHLKCAEITKSRITIRGILDSIQVSQSGELQNFLDELSVLKWSSIECLERSCFSFVDLQGGKSLSQSHLAQKILRDAMAVRFFGGTKELQMNMLMQSWGSDNKIDQIAKKKAA